MAPVSVDNIPRQFREAIETFLARILYTTPTVVQRLIDTPDRRVRAGVRSAVCGYWFFDAWHQMHTWLREHADMSALRGDDVIYRPLMLNWPLVEPYSTLQYPADQMWDIIQDVYILNQHSGIVADGRWPEARWWAATVLDNNSCFDNSPLRTIDNLWYHMCTRQGGGRDYPFDETLVWFRQQLVTIADTWVSLDWRGDAAAVNTQAPELDTQSAMQVEPQTPVPEVEGAAPVDDEGGDPLLVIANSPEARTFVANLVLQGRFDEARDIAISMGVSPDEDSVEGRLLQNDREEARRLSEQRVRELGRSGGAASEERASEIEEEDNEDYRRPDAATAVPPRPAQPAQQQRQTEAEIRAQHLFNAPLPQLPPLPGESERERLHRSMTAYMYSPEVRARRAATRRRNRDRLSGMSQEELDRVQAIRERGRVPQVIPNPVQPDPQPMETSAEPPPTSSIGTPIEREGAIMRERIYARMRERDFGQHDSAFVVGQSYIVRNGDGERHGTIRITYHVGRLRMSFVYQTPASEEHTYRNRDIRVLTPQDSDRGSGNINAICVEYMLFEIRNSNDTARPVPLPNRLYCDSREVTDVQPMVEPEVEVTAQPRGGYGNFVFDVGQRYTVRIVNEGVHRRIGSIMITALPGAGSPQLVSFLFRIIMPDGERSFPHSNYPITQEHISDTYTAERLQFNYVSDERCRLPGPPSIGIGPDVTYVLSADSREIETVEADVDAQPRGGEIPIQWADVAVIDNSAFVVAQSYIVRSSNDGRRHGTINIRTCSGTSNISFVYRTPSSRGGRYSEQILDNVVRTRVSDNRRYYAEWVLFDGQAAPIEGVLPEDHVLSCDSRETVAPETDMDVQPTAEGEATAQSGGEAVAIRFMSDETFFGENFVFDVGQRYIARCFSGPRIGQLHGSIIVNGRQRVSTNASYTHIDFVFQNLRSDGGAQIPVDSCRLAWQQVSSNGVDTAERVQFNCELPSGDQIWISCNSRDTVTTRLQSVVETTLQPIIPAPNRDGGVIRGWSQSAGHPPISPLMLEEIVYPADGVHDTAFQMHGRYTVRLYYGTSHQPHGTITITAHVSRHNMSGVVSFVYQSPDETGSRYRSSTGSRRGGHVRMSFVDVPIAYATRPHSRRANNWIFFHGENDVRSGRPIVLICDSRELVAIEAVSVAPALSEGASSEPLRRPSRCYACPPTAPYNTTMRCQAVGCNNNFCFMSHGVIDDDNEAKCLVCAFAQDAEGRYRTMYGTCPCCARPDMVLWRCGNAPERGGNNNCRARACCAGCFMGYSGREVNSLEREGNDARATAQLIELWELDNRSGSRTPSHILCNGCGSVCRFLAVDECNNCGTIDCHIRLGLSCECVSNTTIVEGGNPIEEACRTVGCEACMLVRVGGTAGSTSNPPTESILCVAEHAHTLIPPMFVLNCASRRGCENRYVLSLQCDASHHGSVAAYGCGGPTGCLQPCYLDDCPVRHGCTRWGSAHPSSGVYLTEAAAVACMQLRPDGCSWACPTHASSTAIRRRLEGDVPPGSPDPQRPRITTPSPPPQAVPPGAPRRRRIRRRLQPSSSTQCTNHLVPVIDANGIATGEEMCICGHCLARASAMPPRPDSPPGFRGVCPSNGFPGAYESGDAEQTHCTCLTCIMRRRRPVDVTWTPAQPVNSPQSADDSEDDSEDDSSAPAPLPAVPQPVNIRIMREERYFVEDSVFVAGERYIARNRDTDFNLYEEGEQHGSILITAYSIGLPPSRALISFVFRDRADRGSVEYIFEDTEFRTVESTDMIHRAQRTEFVCNLPYTGRCVLCCDSRELVPAPASDQQQAMDSSRRRGCIGFPGSGVCETGDPAIYVCYSSECPNRMCEEHLCNEHLCPYCWATAQHAYDIRHQSPEPMEVQATAPDVVGEAQHPRAPASMFRVGRTYLADAIGWGPCSITLISRTDDYDAGEHTATISLSVDSHYGAEITDVVQTNQIEIFARPLPYGQGGLRSAGTPTHEDMTFFLWRTRPSGPDWLANTARPLSVGAQMGDRGIPGFVPPAGNGRVMFDSRNFRGECRYCDRQEITRCIVCDAGICNDHTDAASEARGPDSTQCTTCAAESEDDSSAPAAESEDDFSAPAPPFQEGASYYAEKDTEEGCGQSCNVTVRIHERPYHDDPNKCLVTITYPGHSHSLELSVEPAAVFPSRPARQEGSFFHIIEGLGTCVDGSHLFYLEDDTSANFTNYFCGSANLLWRSEDGGGGGEGAPPSGGGSAAESEDDSAACEPCGSTAVVDGVCSAEGCNNRSCADCCVFFSDGSNLFLCRLHDPVDRGTSSQCSNCQSPDVRGQCGMCRANFCADCEFTMPDGMRICVPCIPQRCPGPEEWPMERQPPAQPSPVPSSSSSDAPGTHASHSDSYQRPPGSLCNSCLEYSVFDAERWREHGGQCNECAELVCDTCIREQGGRSLCRLCADHEAAPATTSSDDSSDDDRRLATAEDPACVSCRTTAGWYLNSDGVGEEVTVDIQCAGPGCGFICNRCIREQGGRNLCRQCADHEVAPATSSSDDSSDDDRHPTTAESEPSNDDPMHADAATCYWPGCPEIGVYICEGACMNSFCADHGDTELGYCHQHADVMSDARLRQMCSGCGIAALAWECNDCELCPHCLLGTGHADACTLGPRAHHCTAGAAVSCAGIAWATCQHARCDRRSCSAHMCSRCLRCTNCGHTSTC